MNVSEAKAKVANWKNETIDDIMNCSSEDRVNIWHAISKTIDDLEARIKALEDG